MLDVIYAAADQLHKPAFDTKYSGDQAITGATLAEAKNSSKLTVIFPPWHVPSRFIVQLERRLVRQGSNVLVYNFNPLILNGDVIKVKNSFEYIALAISEDIAALAARKRIQTMDLLGFSVGNVALCITAEKLDRFDIVTMVVPGNDLAGAFWVGWRTRRLRNVIKNEGYKLAELQKEWADLAPESHLETLKNHPVHIVLAKKDHFIPYNFGKKLYDELRKVNPETVCTTTRLGHVATILRYAADA